MSLRARLRLVLPWLPLAIIVVAGAGLRLDRIGELPPGLYRDEAWYGLDAVGVLNGHPALYFAANNGREGLFIYLLAAVVSFLGQTTLALRLTSALVGIATLGAIYLAGRAFFSHRIGVLAAGVLAGTFWHVALSRVAYRAITLPLFATLGLALAACALRASGRPRQALAVGAGMLIGLTFYTYTSAPFLAPLVLLAAIVIFLRRPADRPVILVIAGVALAALLPMAIWALRHPDLYLARAGQVSILAPEINRGDPIRALVMGVEKTLGMFTLAGDRIWRHNLSLRPVFEGLIGGAFWIGVAAALWRLFRPPAGPLPGRGAHAFLLLWLGFSSCRRCWRRTRHIFCAESGPSFQPASLPPWESRRPWPFFRGADCWPIHFGGGCRSGFRRWPRRGSSCLVEMPRAWITLGLTSPIP